MSTAVHVVAFVTGAVIVVTTALAAMKTVVVPRGLSSTITRVVFITTRRLFSLVTSRRREFAARDRVLAFYAPISLLLLPGVWVGLVLVGFALMQWAAGVSPLGEAFAVSGSSVTTLGFARGRTGVQTALSVVEATLGLGLVALLISYLPSIYAAFSRREVAVGMLEVRAGLPPSPTELITRAHRTAALEGLDELWDRWETWFMEVEESHTSLPALAFFRSPQPGRNWVTAAGCVLDSAALDLALLDRSPSTQAPFTIRTGFFALRRVADYFALPYDPQPAPDAPISVTRDEFEALCDDLVSAGVPLKSDRDQAWRDFAGWRVNYDAALVGLAQLVDAPPARWSSDRAAEYRRPAVLRAAQVDGRSVPRRTRRRGVDAGR